MNIHSEFSAKLKLFKNKKIYVILIYIFCITIQQTLCETNRKFQMWQTPSFFKGFNVDYFDKTKYSDIFPEIKYTGANFVYINMMGFQDPLPPYEERINDIDSTDLFVKKCRALKLYYAITVRQGPGRRDVYWESAKFYPKSTIWTNQEEQYLYASMIKKIVDKYKNDSLFVGIAPILEPNPLFDSVYITSSDLETKLKNNNIDISKIYNIIIDSIRTVDKKIPICIQNVAYSNPEFFSIMNEYSDDYIVYEFHSYRPYEYANSKIRLNYTYPGIFICFNTLQTAYFNKSYLKNTTFKAVSDFQKKVNKPVLLGEFGIVKQQYGCATWFNDIADICIENGWHYAIWCYAGNSTTDSAYNYKKMGDSCYKTVLKIVNSIYTSVDDDNKVTINNPIALIYSKLYDLSYIKFTSNSEFSFDITNTNGECFYTNQQSSNENQNLYEINISALSLNSGTYFARLILKDKIYLKKFLIIK